MKSLLFNVLVLLVGFIAGNLFWYLASPLWIDRVVNEAAAATSTATVLIRQGSFKNADAYHKGSGEVKIIQVNGRDTLRFENFKVTNGPDLYVWLVESSNVENANTVKNGKTFEVAVLKGNIGNQNYDLPEGTNIDDFGSVVIWCKQFGVLFASASLK
ncbi:MAG: DM13 domain-containing protein [Rhizobiales bacterium]|nr:DM13 domain-containing protein [Hyphomicrobiales bacterium]